MKGVIITNNSLQVTFNGSFDHLAIDATSVQNLEIVQSNALSSGHKSAKKASLFGILNTTKTVGGTRLLKANLLQPLKDAETLNTRLDCLDELLSKEPLFIGLSQLLQKFPRDIDRVLSHFAFKERVVGDVDMSGATSFRRNQALVSSIIHLKEAVELLPHLAEVLSRAECSLLTNIRESVCLHPHFKGMRKMIEEVIDEDVLHARSPFIARTQQCFAVRAGVDGFLDVARRNFCETSEAIHALGKTYREDLALPNLKMPFNNRRGFYISVPSKALGEAEVPKHLFQQVTQHGKNIHCTTQELTSLNMRNKEAAAEALTRTERCLEDLCQRIRQNLRLLALLSESISLLDMLANSFAFMVSTSPPGTYKRPEFTEDGPLAIEAGRHPVVEKLHTDPPFSANNTFLSEASNMMIVTGPNMSGKSTYLRQVALITILAHVGCYVPARFASFRIVDHLFTRIGTGDSLETNSSTFMTEMRETAFLMHNVTPRSLIIIDELGRATSTLDGLAIAWSCCEYLLSMQAHVIFATHVQRLAELSSIYPNVKVCYFSVGVERKRLDFKYVLKEGYTDIPHYGLLLAEVAGFPSDVLSDARRIAEDMDKNESKRLEVGYSKYVSLHKFYQLAQRLLCLRHANLSDEQLRMYLQSQKDGYLDRQM
eukprot:jgi/Mesen1/4793/ME000243S03968